MLTEYQFLKASRFLRKPEEEIKKFYQATIDLLSSYYSHKQNWDKIIMRSGEQWKFLEYIGNDENLPIYEGADENFKKLFLQSIREEKEIRSRDPKLKNHDNWRYMQTKIIPSRIIFFESFLEINPKDRETLKKGFNWKWFLIGAGIAAGGTLAYKIKKGDRQ